MQSVLDIRIRQLEEVQQRFALQQQAVVRLDQLIAENREKIEEEMTIDPNTPFDPIMSQQRFHYIQYLKTQVGLLLRQKQQEENKLNAIREELRQAHIGKRTLEILKEKQKQAYLQELAYQEEKEIEDLVVARLHRTTARRKQAENTLQVN